MGIAQQGRGGRRRSRARSNGDQPYLIACGVSGGAGHATAQVGINNCAQGGTGAQPNGAQEVVSRALQGEAWECVGDQGRVRTAFSRKYAHAAGERAYHALVEVVVENSTPSRWVEGGPVVW